MQKKIQNKILFYKILLAFLLIACIVTIIFIVKKYGEQEKYEEKNEQIVEMFNKKIIEQFEKKTELNNEQENTKQVSENETETEQLEFEGHKIIGMIKIPAIDLEYPILEQTTQETMKISISRYWGGDINSYGNVSLAGHNNKITLTMFGKNKNLKNGDRIFLTDLTGKTIEYEIYDSFITHPDDITILQTTNPNIREVTLITCTNGRANRLITKAREIIN